eukprot:COSAG06_NODE_12214_length_1409_cov_2.045802_2_plen_155_part_00
MIMVAPFLSARSVAQWKRNGSIWAYLRKTPLLFEFPYVCPKPVLVKWCVLYINGAKMAFFGSIWAYLLITNRLTAPVASSRLANPVRMKNAPFPQSPLTFVPSLSWQLAVFHSKTNKLQTKDRQNDSKQHRKKAHFHIIMSILCNVAHYNIDIM